jgi:hypothetical protein
MPLSLARRNAPYALYYDAFCASAWGDYFGPRQYMQARIYACICIYMIYIYIYCEKILQLSCWGDSHLILDHGLMPPVRMLGQRDMPLAFRFP